MYDIYYIGARYPSGEGYLHCLADSVGCTYFGRSFAIRPILTLKSNVDIISGYGKMLIKHTFLHIKRSELMHFFLYAII